MKRIFTGIDSICLGITRNQQELPRIAKELLGIHKNVQDMTKGITKGLLRIFRGTTKDQHESVGLTTIFLGSTQDFPGSCRPRTHRSPPGHAAMHMGRLRLFLGGLPSSTLSSKPAATQGPPSAASQDWLPRRSQEVLGSPRKSYFPIKILLKY